MENMSDRLYFESLSVDEDSATFAVLVNPNVGFRPMPRGKYLAVSVSEEHALDSYNSMVECTIHLTSEQAIQLRDMLVEHFPIDKGG